MLQNYIGTRDFLPKDWRIMRYIFRKWRGVSSAYGFEEYDAPILSPLKLFTDKSGEEIKNQLFYFKDKGDRDVCLRAELTPQLARFIINYGKELKKPIKWFSIPRVYRYEKPQKGRLREFFQFNADIIGEDSVNATAEIINLSINILKSLGLKSTDFKIRVNSRKIIDALVQRLGVSDKAGFYLLLDKKSKLKPSDFLKDLKSLVKEWRLVNELFTLPSKKLIVELTKLGVDTTRMRELFKLVDNKYLVFDLSIVRGLAYYTDIVFEAFDTKNEYRAILGGGEYNNLVSDFGGQETPAVGVGMGDAVLLELLKSKYLIPILKPDIVFIATIGNVSKEAVKLREDLISKGYNVDMNLSNRNLSKQFSYAQSKGIAKVYILGEKELSKNIITVKDLNSGKEKKVKLL